MKVIFETAGGQQLQTELSGESLSNLEQVIFRICKAVRDESIPDRMVPDRIGDTFRDYVLVAKEQRI